MESHELDRSDADSGTASPVAPTPPLSIYHLLVATACVAAYLGVTRLAFGWDQSSLRTSLGMQEELASLVARNVLSSVGRGLAFAGLVLMISRLRRGVPFPIHPGEYLLTFLVVCTALQILTGLLFSWDPGRKWMSILGFLLIPYGWCVYRAKPGRWRLFWLLIPLNILIGLFLISLCSSPPLWKRIPLVNFAQISRLALLIVVFYDYRGRVQRPWTHWFGVILYLYFGLVQVVQSIAWIAMEP